MIKRKVNSKYQFAVITEIPKDNDGNYACSKLLIVPGGRRSIAGSNILVDPPEFDENLFVDAIRSHDSGATTIDLTKRRMLMCNTPVFQLGEIMIIDPTNDRTIPDGRKPSKWDVGCEYYDDIESAIKRAREVTA